MKKNKTKKHARLFDNKRVVLVASFLTAFLAWIIVGGWIMPNETSTVDRVAINYTAGSSNFRNRDLELVGDYPETASVRVAGDGSILLGLTNTDVSVYCDYSAVNEAGTYTIPLLASKEGSVTGYDIDEILPDTVTLQFEKVQRTTYTLTVSSDGVVVTDENSFYKDDPELSTLQVEVSGPEGEMEQVASAAVIIDDEVERTTTYTVSDADVVLIDKNGDVMQPSELVTITPAVVSVEIPILPVKKVPLVVSLSGKPAGFDAEWFNSLLRISHETITIAGEASVLENMSEYPVGAVNITTFNKDHTFESFEINLRDNLKNLSGLQQVAVTLDAGSLTQTTFEIPIDAVEVVSGPEGYDVTPVDLADEDAVYTVTLLGDSEQMATILPEDILVQVYANEVDLAGGEQQTLPVRVVVPNRSRVFATGTYTLLCDVQEAPETEDEGQADAAGS